MLKICLIFSDSEPQYAYKRYAYKKNMYIILALYNQMHEEKYIYASEIYYFLFQIINVIATSEKIDVF